MGKARSDNILLEKLSKQPQPNEIPPWIEAVLVAKVKPTLMSTITSKGHSYECECSDCAEREQGPRIPNGIPGPHSDHAGFTCNWCPNALRPWSDQAQLDGANTKRCKIDNREIKAWQRASELAKLLISKSEEYDRRLRFVTLSLPNFECPRAGLAILKKHIRNFRHTKQFQKKVLGGSDFYEWTERIDPVTGDVLDYNVHYHGVWLGNYWKQDNLLDSWSHGGARIEIVRKKYESQDTVRYCTKYLTKMRELNLRSRQTFGVLYNNTPPEAEASL